MIRNIIFVSFAFNDYYLENQKHHIRCFRFTNYNLDDKTGSARPGPAQPSPAQPSPARRATARRGSARHGPARPGPARPGSAWLGPTRPLPVDKKTKPTNLISTIFQLQFQFPGVPTSAAPRRVSPRRAGPNQAKPCRVWSGHAEPGRDAPGRAGI